MAAALWLAAVQAPVAGAQAGSTLGGPVIIGGDDLTDHGFYDAGADENRAGWLYLEKALQNLAPNVTRANDGTIAALGSAEGGGGAGEAIARAAQKAGMQVVYYNGAEAIAGFLDDLDRGAARPRIVWIAGNGAGNDLDSSEAQALADSATTLGDFVNTGGGLMSHGSEYSWLFGLLPGLSDAGSGSSGDLYLTPSGQAAFPGLTNSDVNAGPWHNHFEGDRGGLDVLVRSTNVKDSRTGEDAAVVLGGAAVVLPGSINVEPQQATNPPGTSHTVVATVRNEQGAPIEGETVDFRVISGPNAGASGSDVTDANGRASFTYTSNGQVGTDTIEASFVDDTGTRRSATATKTWGSSEGEPPPPPPPPPPAPSGGGPAPADVGVRVSGPSSLDVGETGTYVFEVFNAGPGEAPNTTFAASLPSNLVFVSGSADRGSCSPGQGRFECSFGTLASGDTVRVEIRARGDSPGEAVVRGEVGTSASDPNVGANNAGTATTQVGGTFQPPLQDTPGPTFGVDVQAEVVAGTVLVRFPGQTEFVPLTGIADLPVGTEVDATNGTVRITHALPDGTLESGLFSGGRFIISQRVEDGGITQLALSGGDFGSCGTRVLSARSATPVLRATVGPGNRISLTTANGRRVRSLDAGTYRVLVQDNSTRDGFHLVGRGVERSTTARFRGRTTWVVRLEGATRYRFFSGARRGQLRGSFQVVSRTVRQLWGNADGKFRTRGRYASATVRGTVWQTGDLCEGTRVRVREDSVTLRDFVREIDVVVRAGQAYLARPGVGTLRTCTIVGTPGNDVLRGTNGADVICALDGNDRVIGMGGNDVLLGGDGNDFLEGGSGDDRAAGGNGDDRVLGGPGDDVLFGGFGGDRLDGGAADDTLFGGPENDVLLGGPGNDGLHDRHGVNRLDGGPGVDRCRTAGPAQICP